VFSFERIVCDIYCFHKNDKLLFNASTRSKDLAWRVAVRYLTKKLKQTWKYDIVLFL